MPNRHFRAVLEEIRAENKGGVEDSTPAESTQPSAAEPALSRQQRRALERAAEKASKRPELAGVDLSPRRYEKHVMLPADDPVFLSDGPDELIAYRRAMLGDTRKQARARKRAWEKDMRKGPKSFSG